MREPNRSLLVNGELNWLWEAAERFQVPLMVNVPNLVSQIGSVAERYTGLDLAIDHLGLVPTVTHTDFTEALRPTIALSRFKNVAVKASALPSAVSEPYPFPTLHEPIRRVFEAFGPKRVFWGSDLTRLSCSYAECVELFTRELDYISSHDLEWVMGRGVCEWLGWAL